MGRSVGRRPNSHRPTCANCDRRIYGMAETLHGRGWVHDDTGAERCNRFLPARPENLASPAQVIDE